jgi:hypothetical protein
VPIGTNHPTPKEKQVNLSDVIAELQRLLDLHGDVKIVDESDSEVIGVEFNDEDDDPAIVFSFA